MMKVLMFLMCMGAAGLAGAVDDVDTLGFVVPGAEDVWGAVLNTGAEGEIVTLYFELSNPSLGGVTGWEACVAIDGELINPVWTIHGTAPMPTPEPDEDGCFQVGISPLWPVEPRASGLIRLATLTAAVPTSQTRVELRIHGVPGSTTFPGTPGYAGPDPGMLAPLSVRSAGEDGPALVINGEAPVRTEELGWSHLKSMYR